MWGRAAACIQSVGCIRHLAVRIAVSILAKVPVFKAVGVGDMSEGGAWKDEAAV